MPPLTMADQQETVRTYNSERHVGVVLIGKEAARLLIEAITSGNNTGLQGLLLQPQCIKTMLE